MIVEINSVEKWNTVFQDMTEASKTYVLTNNIIFNEQPNIPRLTGCFNGKCKTLTINYQKHKGFLRLDGGLIKNVKIRLNNNASINDYQGGLTNTIQWNGEKLEPEEIIKEKSVIKNCEFYGNISGNGCGGITAVPYLTVYKNLLVMNCKMEGNIFNFRTSGICSQLTGWKGSATVINCSVKGTVSGRECSGLVGTFSGIDGKIVVKNCSMEGEVLSNNEEEKENSGVIGQDTVLDLVEDCFFIGKVSGISNSGVIGNSSVLKQIKRCYMKGEVFSKNTSEKNCSGVIGEISGTNPELSIVEDCFFKGNVSGNFTSGVMGQYGGLGKGMIIRRCYMEGCVSNDNPDQSNFGNASGVCGSTFSSALFGRTGNSIIEDCYFKGKLIGFNVAGITGSNSCLNNSKLTIRNCKCEAVIDGDGIGGICGQSPSLENGNTIISNCSFSGKIRGNNNGGIVANQSLNQGFTGGITIIDSCSVNACITATNSGGIIGSNSVATITDCSVSGCISGEGSGSICGADTNDVQGETPQRCSVRNCKITTIVKGNKIGGIFGINVNSANAENVCLTGVYTGVNGAIMQSGEVILTGEVKAKKPSQASGNGTVINKSVYFKTF